MIYQNEVVYGQDSIVKDLYDKANSFYDQGNYEEAITYYDKVLAMYPIDIDVLNNKGETLDNLGRYKELLHTMIKSWQ